jgi:hypothetical protein
MKLTESDCAIKEWSCLYVLYSGVYLVVRRACPLGGGKDGREGIGSEEW